MDHFFFGKSFIFFIKSLEAGPLTSGWIFNNSQALTAGTAADGVDAVPRGILAAHQARPGRGAVGTAGVGGRELHARSGQAVQVRRLDLAPVAAQVGVAHVVRHDEDDVGPPRQGGALPGCGCARKYGSKPSCGDTGGSGGVGGALNAGTRPC